jgi:ParB family transcriptional regulator, chromosome partitioning protein
MTIQLIPLNKLRLSVHNVRKTGAENNLDELVANIEAKGLLQNLIGGAAKKKGIFDIFAGGRRLRALTCLAEAGKIAKDYPVPVNVLDASADEIGETSLAENFIREGMTPTDECKAFLHFLGTDGDIDGVAKRFGQTRRFVEGRLRLANLADAIFDTLAAGDMTMEVAKAYAATPDQAKQLAVFVEVQGSWLATNAHEIRKRILGASIPASHPVALLVGEARYTQAGGRIARDLFTAAESAEWLDGDLATQIAGTLLQDAAATHAEANGIGTVIPLLANASSWSDREDLTHARLERAPLSDAATTRIKAIEAEHAAIEATCEATEMDEDEINVINVRVEALEREEAELRNTELLIDADRKAALTQFIVIGEDGTPYVEPGYWEAPRARGAGEASHDRYSDPKKVAAKAQGLTGVLADELAMARRDVLALHIASDPSIALNLAIFTLADNAFGKHGNQGCSLAVNRRNDPITRGGLPDSPAGGALAEISKQLNTDWTDHKDITERFDAFCALDNETRAAWLAVCVAGSIEASLGGKGMDRHNPFHDHLGQLLDIDVAAWWRPSAGGYFARVRKAGMQRTLGDIGGPVLAAKYASSKSAEMADACEKLCSGSAITEPEIREAALAWLPSAMRFDAGGTEDPEPVESEDDEPVEPGEDNTEQSEVAPPDFLASYQALKTQVGDTILLFRMGDFYEMFGDDAVAAAIILDLAITQRGAGANATEMVGIPVHAAEAHVARLIHEGVRVAIAERVENGQHAVIRVVSAEGAKETPAPAEDVCEDEVAKV